MSVLRKCDVNSETQTILIGRAEAAKALGLGLRTFDRWSQAGTIGPRPVRLGGKLLWRIDELRAWAKSGDGNGTLPDRVTWLDMQRKARRAG